MFRTRTAWAQFIMMMTVFLILLFVYPFYGECRDKDVLKVGEMWEIKGMDPAKEGIFVKEKALIVETLVEADTQFRLKPSLAESWTMKSDTVWTFKLVPGVVFHNGKPLTAETVAWSINRALKVNPTNASMTRIKKVTVTGELTLEIETTCLYPILPAALVYCKMGICHSDSQIDQQGNMVHPIGTGPYKLVEWKKAQQKVLLEANDDYWGEKPKIKKIVYRSIPDAATRSLEIQKGSVDFVADVPYGDLERLRKKGANVTIAFAARVYMLNFGSLVNTPFADKRVRLALSHALNREEISKYVLFGMGEPAGGPFNDQMVFGEKSLTPRSYDPEKAKSLLKEAGYTDSDGDDVVDKDGQALSIRIFTYPQRPALKPMAMAIQQQWSKIGVKASVRVMDWAALNKAIQPGDARLSAYSTALIPDPDFFLRPIYGSSGGGNSWGYENPEVDALLLKGSQTTDMSERFDIYRNVQKIVCRDVPLIYISHYGVNTVYNSRIKGFVFHPVAHDYMLNTGMYFDD